MLNQDVLDNMQAQSTKEARIEEIVNEISQLTTTYADASAYPHYLEISLMKELRQHQEELNQLKIVLNELTETANL